MQAVRIQPSQGPEPYSAANPAPSPALVLESDVPVPELKPGQVLVRVHATTVTRDELTWPESYHHEYRIPGYDFSGVVERVYDSDKFKPGDEVYAMVSTTRGSTWAEFAMAEEHELALKPKNLSWAESVAVPLSALTAWQALFVKAAGVSEPNFDAITWQKTGRSLLVTGASGAVGLYIVQFGAQADLHVVAASSSTERNGHLLRLLGADEVVEYADLDIKRSFDVIIDTVGGNVLSHSWDLVADHGSLISIESSSVEFAKAAPAGKEHVNATFFILEPSGGQLAKIARALEVGLVQPFLAYTFPLAEVKAAYDKANGRMDRKGKVVLTL